MNSSNMKSIPKSFYRYKHSHQILISTMKDEIKAKIHFTHVPDWGFVSLSSPVSVNLLGQALVWTLKPDRFYDPVTHNTLRKSQTQRLLLAHSRISRIYFEKLFLFWKKLNVIHQFKNDKFTNWILKIRKRILRAASLCTHCNITKSEANIKLVKIRILLYKVQKNRVYFSWVYFLLFFLFFLIH